MKIWYFWAFSLHCPCVPRPSGATFYVSLNVLFLSFTKVESYINYLQIDSWGESYERTMTSYFVIFAQFLGLCNSLLMYLGQDKQQHPAVHSGGVSRWGVCVCGCCC